MSNTRTPHEYLGFVLAVAGSIRVRNFGKQDPSGPGARILPSPVEKPNNESRLKSDREDARQQIWKAICRYFVRCSRWSARQRYQAVWVVRGGCLHGCSAGLRTCFESSQVPCREWPCKNLNPRCISAYQKEDVPVIPIRRLTAELWTGHSQQRSTTRKARILYQSSQVVVCPKLDCGTHGVIHGKPESGTSLQRGCLNDFLMTFQQVIYLVGLQTSGPDHGISQQATFSAVVVYDLRKNVKGFLRLGC